MRLLIIIVVALGAVSCKKGKEEHYEMFTITTNGISMDCKLPVIGFDRSDSVRINEMVESLGEGSLIFETLGNNAMLYGEAGRKFNVAVRKLNQSEYIFCTTFGIPFPHIFVLKVEPIE